jgi:hypothetical protein
MTTLKRVVMMAALALLVMAPAPKAGAEELTPAQARAIAVEAYVYAYPLVMMDVTRRLMTNLPAGKKTGMGPANVFHHFREYPAADFREVVRPNFDTLYSSAWLDLTKEPMIVTVPDTAGRYYLLPLYDMWTEVYASPGKRTSGTAAASYAIVPRGWSGKLPAGVERIESPTAFNWIIGRTQTNGPKDYAAVHAVQDGFKMTPLSRWGKKAAAPAFTFDPTIDMKTPPPGQIKAMTGEKYFAYAMDLMKLHQPHPTDWSVLARMKRLGLVPGKAFDMAKADPVIRQALLEAPAEALKQIQEAAPRISRVANGWQMLTDTVGVYGNFYLKRAVLAQIGLGANQVDDAIYPMNLTDGDGQPVDGTNDYVIHFSKAELPPVEAFWSITMYDAEGFQAANPLNRFAIGDRDPLTYNPDGSLDLYMQNGSPGADKESNWLPAPRGKLGITMRLYAPRPEVADGRWVPPPIRRVKQ